MFNQWSNRRGGDDNWDESSPAKKRKNNRGKGFGGKRRRDNRGRDYVCDEVHQEGQQLRNQVQELLSWVGSDLPQNQTSQFQQPVQYPRPPQSMYQQYNTPNYSADYNQGFNQGYTPSSNQGYNQDYSQGVGYSQWGQGAGPGGWSSNSGQGYNGRRPPLLPPPPKRLPQNPLRNFQHDPPTKKTLRGVRGGKKVKAKRALREQRKQLEPPPLPQDPEERREEVLKRIDTFLDYIRGSDCDHPVMAIEKGLRLSRVGLRVYYEHEVVHKVGKVYILTGRFSLSEVYLTRAMGSDKQKVRAACYKRALQVLKEKNIEEILALKDVGVKVLQADAMSFFKPDEQYEDPNAIAQERLELLEKGELTVSEEAMNMISSSSLEDMKVEENLVSMIGFLKNHKRSKEDTLVYLLDINAPRHQLRPKCVIKLLRDHGSQPEDESFVCEYYLTNLLIATGEGSSRVSAQADCYEKAYSFLTTGTLEEILTEGKAERGEDSNVKHTEVWLKSKLRNAETNVWRLKLHKLDPIEICRDWHQAVVIETNNWCQSRKKNAFSILLMTANWNGMLLEWNIQPLEEDPNVFRCEMYMQRNKLGVATSPDKQAVRNLAAADALFKLYETQAVIKVKSSFKSREIEITVDQVKKRGLELKAESGDTSEDDYIITLPEHNMTSQEEEADSMEEHMEEEEEEKDDINSPYDRLVYQTGTEDFKTDLGNETSTEGTQDKTEGETTSENVKTANVPNRFRVNKWHKMAIEEIVEDYSKKDTLAELRFLSGFQMGEIEQVKVQAKKFSFRVAKDKSKHEVFFKVFKRRMPDEILEALIRIGQTSGRFTLVPRNELPSHRDMERILRQAADTL